METRYRKWIDLYYPSQQVAYNVCAAATIEMVADFPELRRVRGHYHSQLYTEPRPHWWCVDLDGEIVDPTARQFVDGGCGRYVEYTGEEPIGRCLNCGGPVMPSCGYTHVCSENCRDAAIAVLKNPGPLGRLVHEEV